MKTSPEHKGEYGGRGRLARIQRGGHNGSEAGRVQLTRLSLSNSWYVAEREEDTTESRYLERPKSF